MAPLRLYLTLSGGASLGAYEAGAAAGVALAARHLDAEKETEVSIDAIGGASAGALVSFFASYALVNGLDPAELLHEAWVERVSLGLLRSGGSDALLSFDELRRKLAEVLAADGPAEPAEGAIAMRQERPIALHVQLVGLRGLSYPIRGLRRDAPITGATYADWGRFELEPGCGYERFVEPRGRSPLDFVLASAASPGGFAPQLLDRSDDRGGYESRGVESFPESGQLWYTDGGMLGSQPVGRVIGAGRALHGAGEDSNGVHLLIDPRSEDAETDVWADPEASPGWLDGAARALGILSEQSLFDDLRRIEKDNSRLEWSQRLADDLAARLGDDARAVLRKFIESVAAERDEMRADEPHREAGRQPGEDADVRELLGLALAEVAGLSGKERVSIDVISPQLLRAGDEDVGELLAGEFMGDFGGFLSRELRASDFALGYESAIAWLDGGLRECELDEGAVDRAVEYVRDRRRYDPTEVGRGDAGASDLSLADRAELARLGAHATRVLAAAIVGRGG